MTDIQKRLYAMQDKEYRSFQSRLMPTVNPDKIIGVRVPQIRELARDVMKNEPELVATFLQELPHQYYEEDNLHVFLVNRTKDFATCLMQVEAFLPHLDNWATCDSFRPEVFRQHRQQVLAKARGWMESGHCYTVRFGIGCMMSYFLDEDFSPEQLELVGGIPSEEYYVRMMQAWYFATALAKQYRPTLTYLSKNNLEVWTHNKAIQKAVESHRITTEQKALLRKMKRS
ncbi:MAG: DNA alkylation repair protein [Spirochaetaceae bacterium]|nr:DNA alkylation repair protein [Spirochaetaceae bacterium]